MFRKELADVTRQTLYFLAVVLALPAAFILFKIARGPYVAVFMPALQGGLLFWALFLGASLLGRERRQRAMEYALALPYSRAALLGRLVGARAIILAALWALSWIIYAGWGASYSAFHQRDLALFYFSLFVISVSLAPLIENFIALCLVSVAAWYVSIPISYVLLWAAVRAKGLYIPWWIAKTFPRKGLEAIPSNIAAGFQIIRLILPIIPFAVALLLSFRKFDIRPSAAFVKRYLKTFAISLAVCLAGVFGLVYLLTPGKYYSQVYLTSDQRIVEFQPYVMKIHNPAGIIKVKNIGSVWWRGMGEDGPDLVLRDEANDLIRLNTLNGTTRTIFEAQKEDRFLYPHWTYQGKTAFFSRSASRPLSPLALVVIDNRAPEDQKPQVIPCRHEFFETKDRAPAVPYLFGTGVRDGRTFWLIAYFGRSRGPLRLWDDGRTEELFPGESCSFQNIWFVNGLLLRFDKDELKIYRDQGKGFELVKSKAESFSFSNWDFLTRDLEARPVRLLFGKRGDKIAKLNLETLEIEDVAPLRTAVGAQVIACLPDRFYLREIDETRGTMRISLIDDKGVTLLREFANFDVRKPFYVLDFQRGGIVLRRANKIEAYAFPDLRKLRY